MISGIPPGNTGTGNFLEYIYEHFQNLFHFVFLGGPYDDEIKKHLENISSCIILLFHPQTIGFETFKKLVNKNKCFLYVLDNSFFCGASYNYVRKENQSCFRCLENKENETKYECSNPWQFGDFTELSERIFFFAQNKSQKKLLLRKFGKNIKVEVLGLNIIDNFSRKISKNFETGFDIVYHGAETFAKGYEFAKRIDECAEDISIYFPKRGETWDSGLRDTVQNAKIILNPSLWSSPVEGALLKSIKYNGCVAVASTKLSFVEEIPSNTLIRLDPENISACLASLRLFLADQNKRNKLRILARRWLNNYENRTNEMIRFTFLEKFKRKASTNPYLQDFCFTKQKSFHECKITISEVHKISSYSVFCLSEKTKHLIQEDYIHPEYIFDQNKRLHGKVYRGIKVLPVDVKNIRFSKNILIISNHSKEIYNYLLSLPLKNKTVRILD